MADINLKPIGHVISSFINVSSIPLSGNEAIIEVYPEYTEALLRVEENSHLWVLSWFDLARRDVLSTRPERVNPNLPEFGVFGLRAPARPNPIGLSLTKLVKVEGNRIHVLGLDAVGGTPVLDIKPYFEWDVIFSPGTPDIRPVLPEKRYEFMLKEALNHHQEDCIDLRLAIRMGLIAGEEFGQLNSPDLFLFVKGTLCFGDVLQGISKARLSNPPRFNFTFTNDVTKSVWQKGNKVMTIELKQPVFDISVLAGLSDTDLFVTKVIIKD